MRKLVPLLLVLLTVAACMPRSDEPTLPPRRSEITPEPTTPPPDYVEPFMPVTVENAPSVRLLGRLDPPNTGVGSISAYSFAVDGTRLAVITRELVMGWDLLNGELTFFTAALGGRDVFYSLDKTELYVIDTEGFVRIFDGETGNQLTTFTAQDNYSGDIVYDPEAGVLATASRDGQISVWDPLARDLLVRFNTEDPRITSMVFMPGAETLAIATAAGGVELWDWGGRERQTTLTTGEGALPAGRLAVSPDGSQIAVGTEADMRLWNADARVIEHILLTGEGGSEDVLAFTPDGTYIVNSGLTEAINIWTPDEGDLIAALPTTATAATSAAFSPSGDLMLTSSFQGTTAVWDLTNITDGQVPAIPLNPESTIINVGWSDDGRTLALFDTVGSVLIYGVPAEPTPTPAAD